jgi:hypothetical protein
MKRGRPPKPLPPDVGAIVDERVDGYRSNRTELDAADEKALRAVCPTDAFVADVQNAIRTAVVITEESADDPKPAQLRKAAARIRNATDATMPAALGMAGGWSSAVCGMEPVDALRDPEAARAGAAKREAAFRASATPRARLRDVLESELRAVFVAHGLSASAWTYEGREEAASPFARAYRVARRVATGTAIAGPSVVRDVFRRRR